MATIYIDQQSWEERAEDRDAWHKRVLNGRMVQDDAWFEDLDGKRAQRRQNATRRAVTNLQSAENLAALKLDIPIVMTKSPLAHTLLKPPVIDA